MSTSNTNTEWIPQQIKVFSRWVASHLSEGKSDVQVNDVTKDLSNGVALVELAEILTGKEAPSNWAHNPKHIAQMVTNNDMAIDMFTKDGVQFVGISGKDIHDSKEKLVLGLVWTLILRYSIGQSIENDGKDNAASEISSSAAAAASKNNKDALIQWAIERTENYPNVNSFKPHALSMCALLDSYVPEKISFYSLDSRDSQHNAELATSVMKELGIPVFLDSDDLQDTNVDEKALLTQLSTAKVVLERLPPPTPAPASHVEEAIEEEPVVQTRDIDVAEDTNADAMREIEESMRRDQEENKNLPDKIVIDGLEFTNIRVREISLEPQVESKEEETEVTQNTANVDSTEVTQNTANVDSTEVTQNTANVDSTEVTQNTANVDSTEVTQNTANVDSTEVTQNAANVDSTEVTTNAASAESSVSDEEEEVEAQSREVEPEFVPRTVEGDNSQYAGRKFGLVMLLNENDYNNGEKVDLEDEQLLFGEDVQFALTMVKDKQPYLNPAGLKLTIAEPNIENDVFQQFTFGKDDWNTVIDSVQQQGMVWDVADEFNTNPPSGTPFYLFPFHGRHNQHFVYKDGMIYAQQNGQVVTFVGGDEPLVMMPPSNQLRARQTFTLQLL
ncbi:hypothetical protein M9Y10_026909 [Tritrichomonas musculus]|uniref:Calponin-homology (CH) domain-containing protein n=1 Tax=Tritrichomonas musculus TaxID=1915356 RepID=A0ABR2H6W9_9EUKA